MKRFSVVPTGAVLVFSSEVIGMNSSFAPAALSSATLLKPEMIAPVLLRRRHVPELASADVSRTTVKVWASPVKTVFIKSPHAKDGSNAKREAIHKLVPNDAQQNNEA
jgi:hypothetical protein